MSWPRIALPVYWIALAAATHYPSVRVPDQVPQNDKILHFTAFAGLAFLFWQLLASRARPLTASSVWLAALVLVPYAAIDEYTQQYVGRHTDFADWIANVAGITVVLTALEIRRRIRASRAVGAA